MQFDVKLSDDFAAALDKFEADIKAKVLRAGAGAMSYVLVNYALTYAAPHRKTGQLYDAIYQVHAEDLSTAERQVYRVSWNRSKAPHGHLIEFGTSRAPAYPFIRPAFDHIGEAIKAGMARMAERLQKGGTE